MPRLSRWLTILAPTVALVLFAGFVSRRVDADGGAASPSIPVVPQVARTMLDGPELVYRLTQFVYWPPEPDSQRSFAVCLAGEDPDYVHWTHLLTGREITGSAIAIRPAAGLRQMRACKVLFIGRSLQNTAAQIVNELESQPVLTVASFSGFSMLGGMVELPCREQRRLLTVNVEAVRRAGLSLNRGILSVAAIRRTGLAE